MSTRARQSRARSRGMFSVSFTAPIHGPGSATLLACRHIAGADEIARMRALSSPAGPTGSGKSVLMLQTVSYAQATGYVVLYLPSGTHSSFAAPTLAPCRLFVLTSVAHTRSHSARQLFHSPRLLRLPGPLRSAGACPEPPDQVRRGQQGRLQGDQDQPGLHLWRARGQGWCHPDRPGPEGR